MRRFLMLSALFLAACGSSNHVPSQAPEVRLRQLVGPADQGFPQGPIQVKYEVTIANRSSQPLTLTHFDIESVGTGAYTLVRDTLRFKQTIAPLQMETVQFWARAYSRVGQSRAGVGEPVTFRGVLYFDSPAGIVHKVIMTNLPQGNRSSD